LRTVLAAVLVPLVTCCALFLGANGCHAPGPPAEAVRTPLEKPWTKEAIEKNAHLWIELGTKRRGIMTGPVLAHDDKGEYLTTKDDASVHLPLAEVTVMDAIELPDVKLERKPIEKPWTAAAVEAHERVWVETSTGRRQMLGLPTVACDEQGEYLTTKNDAHVHVPLSDVTVLDSVEEAPDDSVSAAGVAAQSVGGSFLAFWTVVLCFLPAIVLVAIFA
jgi:hypothetical protein